MQSCVLAPIFFLHLLSGVPDAPRLTLDREEYDFGIIMQNSVRKATIRVSNTGDAPLLIRKITNSCGCAVPERWKNVTLPPGGARDLPVTLHGKRYYGRLRKHIKLFSNDPRRPEVTCWVIVEVKADYLPERRSVVIENLRRDKKTRAFISIRNFMKTPLEFHDLRSGAPWVRARLVPPSETGGKREEKHEKQDLYRLELEVDGTRIPPGRKRLACRVTCKTNAPSMKEDVFLVMVNIAGDLKAEPERVLFPPCTRGEERTVRVRLAHRKGRTFTVTRIRSSSPFVRCTVEGAEEGRGVELRVTLAGNAPAGMIRGEIRLSIDGAGDPSLVIPFSGLVRPSRGKEEHPPPRKEAAPPTGCPGRGRPFPPRGT